MKNKLGLKLKIEKFVKEQLWQLVVVVVLLTLFAFIFDKYIECVLFCVSHTVIRNSFCKQYHCGTTALCLFLTLSIGWFGISTVLPTSISILSSIPLCFVVAFLGFIAQDRVDKIKENSYLLKDLDLALSKVRQYENIDIYKLTETELRQFGALFGGFGGNGFGGGRGGACATQADLAAGFNNSAVLSSLNDIKLGQAQAINYNNQGFAGLNQTITNGFAGVNNAVCTLGYQQAQLVNGLSRELGDCCCKTQVAIQDLKYSNERQTCDIIAAINAGNQRLVDIYTNDKIDALRTENAALKGQISNDRQSNYIISQLREPCPVPSYIVPNPNCCYQYNVNGVGYNNGGCGCGC